MPIDYRLVVAGLLAVSASTGCLPSPDIHVPDFSSPPPVDAGLPVADLRTTTDGATSPDLAPALRWLTDAQGVTTENVRAVWAADAALSQVYAVGQNGLILHRDGGTWKKEVATFGGNPIITNLYAVAAVTPDTIYAVGEAGVILRRSAGVWNQEGAELGTTVNLYGLTVLTSGEVIVVGDNGFIARRGTTTYAAETTTALGMASLRAVSGSTLDGLYAVGLNAVVARRVMDKWQLDTVPIDAADKGPYYAVTQNTEGVFVAGQGGRVLRRDTAKWLREATVAATPVADFYGLLAAGSDVFVVGSGGAIQRRDAATKAWAVESTAATSVILNGVAGAGTSAIAVGEQGTLLRRM